MRNHFFVRAMMMGITLIGLAGLSESRADQTPVHAGYDLFQTDPTRTFFDFGSPFDTQNLMGVPLGTFDFGGSIGVQNVGATDTIVQRTQDVTTGGGTTPLQMLALQLESVNAVDASGDHLFVRLTPGVASGGTMTINDDDTFHSTLDVHFDVLLGTSLASATPIATDQTATLGATSIWTHVAPPGALKIPGVNFLLDGRDTAQDFWPGVTPAGVDLGFDETGGNNEHHFVHNTTIPEPSAWIMLATAGVIVPACARWRRRRA